MAETYLTLLNSAQQQGANFATAVQQTLDASFRAREEVRQFDQRIAVQQSQFAEEQAFRYANLEEERRVNNMNAERYMFLDELAAKKFEAEAALEPLRLEAAKTALEANKINRDRALQENRDKVFNSITSPFDTQAAALLAGSRSEEFGNSYLALKSKYQAEVARGAQFDEAGFRSEYDALAQQYTGVTPNKEYNPALATLLDRMGAPNEANRMRSENPVYSGSIIGLKSGALTGGRDAFAATVAKYGSFLGKEEDIAAFSMAGDAYFGLGETIQTKSRELDTLIRSQSYAKTPEQKQAIDSDINELRQEISEAQSQRREVYRRAIGVQTANAPDPSAIDPDGKVREMIERAKKNEEKVSLLTPDPPVSQVDPNTDIQQKRATINNFVAQFPEALGDPSGENPSAGTSFNFRNWQGEYRDIRGSTVRVTQLRNHIIKNLNNIPTNNADREGDQKTLEELILSPSFGKIFEQLKGKSVRTPPLGAGYGNTFVGDSSAMQVINQFIEGSALFGVPVEIESMDDVRDLLKNYDGPESTKRNFMEKLYGSVIAAGAVDSFSLPE